MQLLLFIKGCERGGRWARQRQLKTCKQAEKFRMFVATPWHFVTGAQKWKFYVHFPANHAFELHYKSAGTKSTDKHITSRTRERGYPAEFIIQAPHLATQTHVRTHGVWSRIAHRARIGVELGWLVLVLKKCNFLFRRFLKSQPRTKNDYFTLMN